MEKTLLFTFVIVFLFGCKPYQETKLRKNQITYEKFREDQKFFRSSDGVIKYIDKGEGPVIVLLHGVPTSGWLYRKMMYPLIAGGYRVIIPDMLGFGSSDSPESYDLYSEENHAKRLLALLNSLKIKKWTQVVHDAGGLWTWELMKQAPNRIKKLILLNSIIYPEGYYPSVCFKPGTVAKTAVWSYSSGVTTNSILKKLFETGLQENTLNEIDIQGYKQPWIEKKTDALYYFFTKTCNGISDYTDVFDTLEIPVAVIWGIHDTSNQWTPQQKKVRIVFDIADKNIHLIDEKHFIQETHARDVSYKILNFLEAN